MDLNSFVITALTGRSIDREEALALLAADDDEVLSIVAAAGRVRRQFFGRRVLLNYLVNLKSGLCPEDCHYCSQAMGSTADIPRYSWLSPEQIAVAVEAGVSQGASTVCLVASGRGPSEREVARVAEAVAGIRRTHPSVKICTCLGFLDEDKAATLAAAGADRYNHNLNTAADNYPEICGTHTFADRVATVRAATSAGLSPCSGLIVGLGESDEQLVDVAFALRDLGVDSVPVNFLLPFEGTPLGAAAGEGESGAPGTPAEAGLTPLRVLKVLAMVRFVHPDTEVRCSAGREHHLRSLQPLALEICSSIFLGDYLTAGGQPGAADLAMIEDLGFEVVAGRPDGGEVCWGHDERVLAAVGQSSAAAEA
ncbi:MAG: biotin synthase BioB [Austwickia sp.]|jgi:biotin synthase|nr:MAG: biotin synthase BioB [Austwickia sp.]